MKKLVILFLGIICVVLEVMPGSVIITETLNQGTEVVYHSYSYCDFTIWGMGYWGYNVLFILSVICLVACAFNSFSILVLQAIVNLICVVMFYPVSYYTFVILGIMLVEAVTALEGLIRSAPGCHL